MTPVSEGGNRTPGDRDRAAYSRERDHTSSSCLLRSARPRSSNTSWVRPDSLLLMLFSGEHTSSSCLLRSARPWSSDISWDRSDSFLLSASAPFSSSLPAAIQARTNEDQLPLPC